jgi:hypothetical protein
MREVARLRASDPQRYANIRQIDIEESLARVTTRPAEEVQLPSIAELARAAGYPNPESDLTTGMTQCLEVQVIEASGDDGVGRILDKRWLAAKVHRDVRLDWADVTAVIRRGIPLAVTANDGAPYLVVGYAALSCQPATLFAFDPVKLERGVYFAGHRMTEGRLADFRAEHPELERFSDSARYFDVPTVHKQHQYPGFCAIRYSEHLRFSYVDSVEVGRTRISAMVKQAMETLAQPRSVD